MNLLPPVFRHCPFCGNSLGTREEEGHQRSYCHACQWTYYPRVAISVSTIITRGKEVLLVKRRREPYKGTWMFPSGFNDYGEHPEETARREVREETSLTVTGLILRAVCQSPDDPREPGHIMFFYDARVAPGEIATDPDENEAIDWFPINAPPLIGWELHQRFMAELQEQHRAS